MLILLPLMFVLLTLVMRRRGEDWRRAILIAAVAAGVLLVAMTELLSLFMLVTPAALALGWIGVIVVLAVMLIRTPRREPPARGPALGAVDWALLAGLALIFGIAAFIALAAPPNNWDSMTYHLPRVEHWLQNQTVANYTTSVPRQLYQPPAAEYAILHARALSGGDRFSNSVQWLAMVGCLVAVSALARLWGLKPRGQVLAAVVAGTLGMGIFQAMTTQNDAVTAFWLAVFVYFILESIERGVSWPRSALIGLSLGLALLTKGTAAVLALPFAVWFAGVALRRLRWRAVAHGAAIGALALALALPFYIRTTATFGSPLGGEQGMYSNQTLSLPVLISNVVRNTAMHLAPPAGPLNDRFRISDRLNRAVSDIHRWIGLDASDPGTTWPGTAFSVGVLDFDEDSITNPVHLLLVMVAIPLYFIFFRRTRRASVTWFVVCWLAACLLFSAALRWQPWHSRLHLPLFVLISPFIAYVFDRLVDRRLIALLASGLLVFGLWNAPQAKHRSLVADRNILNSDATAIQFFERPELQAPYEEAVRRVIEQGCTDVGLRLNGDPWEYPLWRLFREAGWPVRMTHLIADDTPDAVAPCAVIRLDMPDAPLSVGGTPYAVAWTDRRLALLTPEAGSAGG